MIQLIRTLRPEIAVKKWLDTLDSIDRQYVIDNRQRFIEAFKSLENTLQVDVFSRQAKITSIGTTWGYDHLIGKTVNIISETSRTLDVEYNDNGKKKRARLYGAKFSLLLNKK